MLALQTKVEELSAKLPKIGPRRLTSEQSQQLTAALKGHPHMIKIVRDVSIPDAWDYAQDFKRAFEAAGWSVLEGDVMGLGRHPNFGIGLQISTKDSFTAPAGKLLEQAFQAAGLKHEVLNTFENFMPKGTPMMRTPIGSIIIARDTITTA